MREDVQDFLVRLEQARQNFMYVETPCVESAIYALRAAELALEAKLKEIHPAWQGGKSCTSS